MIRLTPTARYLVIRLSEDDLIDEPGVDPPNAWDRDDFLGATGLNTTNPGRPIDSSRPGVVQHALRL